MQKKKQEQKGDGKGWGEFFLARGFLADVFFPGGWESFVSLLNGEGGFG